FLPRDLAHAYKVRGAQPARMLTFTFPAGFEGFVKEVGSPAPRRTCPRRRHPTWPGSRRSAQSTAWRSWVLRPISWRPALPSEWVVNIRSCGPFVGVTLDNRRGHQPE